MVKKIFYLLFILAIGVSFLFQDGCGALAGDTHVSMMLPSSLDIDVPGDIDEESTSSENYLFSIRESYNAYATSDSSSEGYSWSRNIILIGKAGIRGANNFIGVFKKYEDTFKDNVGEIISWYEDGEEYGIRYNVEDDYHILEYGTTYGSYSFSQKEVYLKWKNLGDSYQGTMYVNFSNDDSTDIDKYRIDFMVYSDNNYIPADGMAYVDVYMSFKDNSDNSEGISKAHIKITKSGNGIVKVQAIAKYDYEDQSYTTEKYYVLLNGAFISSGYGATNVNVKKKVYQDTDTGCYYLVDTYEYRDYFTDTGEVLTRKKAVYNMNCIYGGCSNISFYQDTTCYRCDFDESSQDATLRDTINNMQFMTETDPADGVWWIDE